MPAASRQAACFWSGVADNELQLTRCTACGHITGFPHVGCPRCLAPTERVAVAGDGVITTYTVIRHWRPAAEHLPIVMAVIELDAGPEVVSSLVGDDRLDCRIGSRVRATERGWSELTQFELLS